MYWCLSVSWSLLTVELGNTEIGKLGGLHGKQMRGKEGSVSSSLQHHPRSLCAYDCYVNLIGPDSCAITV